MGNSVSDFGAPFAHDFGTMYPLPSELETLPLYPDGDGFYSVNGPTLYGNYSKLPTSHALDNPCFKPAGQTPRISSHLRHQPIDTISEFAIPLIPPLQPFPQPRSSTPALPRRGYTCNEPGCTWLSPFSTRQGLTRHHQAKHLQKRINCPIPGCNKVGDKGIKRKDNVRVHVWNQHGVKLPREPRRLYA